MDKTSHLKPVLQLVLKCRGRKKKGGVLYYKSAGKVSSVVLLSPTSSVRTITVTTQALNKKRWKNVAKANFSTDTSGRCYLYVKKLTKKTVWRTVVQFGGDYANYPSSGVSAKFTIA